MKNRVKVSIKGDWIQQ